MSNPQYRVYATPLNSAFVYGTEVDISDLIESVAGSITSSIDSTDFSVGVYTYNDVSLTCDNALGRLSDLSDSRSLFSAYGRDKAKIRIVFDNGPGNQPTTYRGLINDEATVVISDSDELTFTILGHDSILKNSVIPAGAISNAMTITQALVAILNTADVRSVLGVSLSNLNPQNNIAIDDGTKFDNLNKRDAIAQLLAASDSVMLIDSGLNIIVKDRKHNFGNPIINLYGRGDQFGRENVISISNYNTGLHRTFNSVLVTGGQATVTVTDINTNQQVVTQVAQTGSARDLTSQSLYGLRQKPLTFAWLTTPSKLAQVAQTYVNEFAYAKIEIMVAVSTIDFATAQLLDQVSVNYPLLITPAGKFVPVIGVTAIGDTTAPLPYVKGAISIDGSLGFKIIEKTEDISNFQTIFKLRQVGTTLTDGVLTVPTSTRTITQPMSPAQTTTSDDMILIDATLGDVDVKAVSPVSNPQKEYTYMRIDSSRNNVRVLPFATEYFNGDQTQIELEKKNDSVRIGTDRINWFGAFRSTASIAPIGQKRFTLVNNQVAAADLTGLLLNSAIYREAKVTISTRRRTDSVSEVRARHQFIATYNAGTATWSMQPEEISGDDDGTTLILTSVGQVQYTTTNLSGTNPIHNCDYSVEGFNV